MKRIVELVAAFVALAPSIAWAGNASVAPLVADGVKDEVAVNVTNLVAMELDFMGAFDSVQQMDPRPSGLDKACVTSASCLARIQKVAGTDALVAGVLTGAGKNVTVQLAYLEQGKLVRAKAFTAEGTSSVLADRMGGWMEELVKGVSSQQRAKEADLGNLDALSATDILAAEDLDDDAEDRPRVVGRSSKSGPIPTIPARTTSEDLGAPLTPEEEKAEAARKAAEAQAKAEEAAMAAKRAAEEAEAAKREAAAANGQAPVESWEDISFAPAAITVDSIQFESATSFIQVEGAESAAPESEPEPEPAKSKKESKKAKLAGESGTEPESNDAYASPEKAQQPPKSKSKPAKRVDYAAIAPPTRNAADDRSYDSDSRTKVEKPKKERDDNEPALVGLAVGVGFTQFQALSFLTYGGEIVLRPITHLAFVVGAHAYSVHRNIPGELVASGQPTTTWNTIFPVNLGVQYRLRAAKLEPYVGADGILIPGYVRAATATQDTGSNLAGGGRLRVGIDYKLGAAIALNADLGVAYLSGENFQYVEDGMDTAGVAPQISAGTVFLF
jgi:hypothetical protein